MNMSQNTFMTRTTVTKNRAQLLFATRELRTHTVITESEIIALRRRWARHSSERNGIDVHGEVADLGVALPMRVTDAQAQKGLMWWTQQLYTKHGEPRNTAFLQECEDIEPGTVKMIRRVVRNFSHFELTGFEIDNGAHPIYTMVSRDGESFDYVARPWQQGGSYLIS